MVNRLRTGWLAGSGALVLVLAVSGVAMGATLVNDTDALVGAVVPVDTTGTFEDVDGNGVDDDCQEAVVADPEAAAALMAIVDADGDGAISVTEAAHSDWTGGANCNHGGYVSQVATAADDACEEPAEPVDEMDAEAVETDEAEAAEELADADCEADEAEETDEAEAAQDVVCEAVPAPEPDPALDPEAANSHGAWVAWVAGSTAVGGKNCNHGGAVSEAAKKDQEAAKAERDAAKAERAAERAAAKAERQAAREQRAQDRAAAKATKSGGHGRAKSR